MGQTETTNEEVILTEDRVPEEADGEEESADRTNNYLYSLFSDNGRPIGKEEEFEVMKNMFYSESFLKIRIKPRELSKILTGFIGSLKVPSEVKRVMQEMKSRVCRFKRLLSEVVFVSRVIYECESVYMGKNRDVREVKEFLDYSEELLEAVGIHVGHVFCISEMIAGDKENPVLYKEYVKDRYDSFVVLANQKRKEIMDMFKDEMNKKKTALEESMVKKSGENVDGVSVDTDMQVLEDGTEAVDQESVDITEY